MSSQGCQRTIFFVTLHSRCLKWINDRYLRKSHVNENFGDDFNFRLVLIYGFGQISKVRKLVRTTA